MVGSIIFAQMGQGQGSKAFFPRLHKDGLFVQHERVMMVLLAHGLLAEDKILE